MSEIEKKLKREMDAKVPDLKEKIMAEAFPESAVRQPLCSLLLREAQP